MTRISRIIGFPRRFLSKRRNLWLSFLLAGVLCNVIYFGFYYQPAPPQPSWQWKSNASIKALAYTSTTKEIWCATGTHIAIVAIDPPKVVQQFRAHPQGIIALQVSPDGTYAASCDSDGRIVIWQVKTRNAIRRLKLDKYPTRCMAFAPDNTLACAGESGSLHLVNISTGKTRQILKSANDLRDEAIADLKKSSQRAGIKFVLPSWAKSSLMAPPGMAPPGPKSNSPDPARSVRPLTSLAFSPNGSSLATNAWNLVWIWDIKTMAKQREFRTGGTTAMAYSNDGKWLAAAAWLGTIFVWDVKSGTQLHIIDPTAAKPSPITETGYSLSAIAFTPDGKQIVSGGEERTLRVCDVQSGAALGLIPSNEEYSTGIRCLTLSPDGKQIFVGVGNTLKIWPFAEFGL